MKKSTVLKVVGGVTVIATTTAVVIKFLPKIKETVSNFMDVLNWDSNIEDELESEDDFVDEEDLFESEDFKIEPEDGEDISLDKIFQEEVEEKVVEDVEEPISEEMKIKPRKMEFDEEDEKVDLED